MGKDKRKWLLGRPRCKWTNIQVNVKSIRYESLYWILPAQDKVQYRGLVNLKSEIHPRTDQEDPEAEHRYSSTLSLTSKLDGVGWSTPHPGRFTAGKQIRYPFYRAMGGGPRTDPDGCGKSRPTGNWPPDRSDSLCRLRYPSPLSDPCEQGNEHPGSHKKTTSWHGETPTASHEGSSPSIYLPQTIKSIPLQTTSPWHFYEIKEEHGNQFSGSIQGEDVVDRMGDWLSASLKKKRTLINWLRETWGLKCKSV